MAQASTGSVLSQPGAAKRIKAVSKAMSYLLRHHAVDAGIEIRPDGYVHMSDLLAWKRISKLKATKDEIYEVVRDNDKRRFHITIEDGVEFIRAAQGHSIEVSLQLSGLDRDISPWQTPRRQSTLNC